MLYPFVFHPLFKERVWGGRRLEELYHKPLPAGVRVGESWEVSDRPGDVSVIANGPLAGKDLRWLLQNHGPEVLGATTPAPPRFPLLVKLLDARETLSLQVHPPAGKAARLGGEPKTEMWWIAEAAPGAELYVGLRQGVTREEFERRIRDGTVAECFHRVAVQAGDTMFLPSGRVHAIGAGLVIFEIQQNSDTTYRVFDWNRAGLDGKPRALHLAESLESIDFEDFEPSPVRRPPGGPGPVERHWLVRDPLFSVEALNLRMGAKVTLPAGRMQILGTTQGELRVVHGRAALTLGGGQFCLVPACLEQVELAASTPTHLLRVETGQA